MAVLMIIKRLSTYVSPTITSDPAHATLHVCKQQIASGNKLLLVILHSNWLIVVFITVIHGTHLSATNTTDTTTLHVCKQQEIVSCDKLFLVIH